MIQAILILLILILAWVYSPSWTIFAVISIIGILGIMYIEPRLNPTQ